MFRALKHMGAAVVAVLAVLVAVPSPAQASSGGGCGPRVSWHFSSSTLYVTSCISFGSPHLKPDFYVEGSAPGGTNCTVVQQMRINGSAVSGGRHVSSCVAGHYGPWNYAVLPPSGYADARIAIVINGVEQVVSYSPYVYFP
ncbi:hypothetical protein AB0J72_58115 [Dactylosporangium sp. NPDC049742]|uniref:hypothetical protein n=1 Tax=Dactylosporangium sp. NPDC049742 TaxID=3154737 RepID=UPI00343F5917